MNTRTEGAASLTEDGRHLWTFFTNHAHVLLLLAEDPDLRQRDLADAIGITERAVQRIVSELEHDGYLDAERIGRRKHYRVRTAASLRHAVEAHVTVGELVDLVVGKASAAE